MPVETSTPESRVAVADSARPLTVALIGNPNTGKSTLFNALSGLKARVGNYPGVTVEKKIGRTKCDGRIIRLLDLPGTYSLAPRSLDEMVSVDVLLGRQADVGAIDAVVCIVDAANLERNLYLVSQVLDIGLPLVLVLNMSDVAHARGVTIDAEALSQRLGVPVVCTEAHRRRGLDEVRRAIVDAASRPACGGRSCFRPRSTTSASGFPPGSARTCRCTFWSGCCWTWAVTPNRG